jgi:hypothetical protein
MQMEGLFDVSPSQRSEERWTINLELPEAWNVGLIVGPSGSGKTTVARELFGSHIVGAWEWDERKSLLDGFPAGMSIKEIVNLLSSVGFSSPPSWVRPFQVLSNGEQFRVSLARTLSEMPELAVVDEFTSVVDRTVAQIGSAAVAKAVRRRNQKFIAVTCHYDVWDWLEPDWVFQPHTGEFLAGRRERRPTIELTIRRVHSSAWQLFRKHHYLDHDINTASVCFCAFWKEQPVAFTSMLHMPHPKTKNLNREHRTVCLPDFQGVGIGNALSRFAGSLCHGMGFRYCSVTSHPAMIRYRDKSPDWKMTTAPTMKGQAYIKGPQAIAQSRGLATRIRATFEYVGPAMEKVEALRLYGGKTK